MSAPCRVAVMSSTTVGRRSIEEGLLALPDCRVVGIFTTPAEIDISYSSAPVTIRTHARFDDLAARARADLVCFRERPTTASYLATLQRWSPDLLLVLGWYYVVPRDVRAAARLGCLGIHGSLLPKYRGGAPIPWAIINGETATGVTLFHLEDDVDGGDIVLQREFAIGRDDTCADVIARAGDASIDVLRHAVPLLARGTAPRRRQRQQDALWCPQRSPEDGRVDWRWPARRVHDFVRAQTRPYAGAFTTHAGARVTLWTSSVTVEGGNGLPGEFRLAGDRIVVSCGRDALAVSRLGTANVDTCSAAEFAYAIGVDSGRFDPV